MDTHTWLSTAAFAAFVVMFVGYYEYRKRALDVNSCPFPPGPPALPIIGNILSVKPQGGWHSLTEYSKTYGMSVAIYSIRLYLTRRTNAQEIFFSFMDLGAVSSS
jgi:hypothetical protein